MKAVSCQAIATLLDVNHTEIDETSETKLDKVCYSFRLVEIDTEGNIKIIEITPHMLVFEKCYYTLYAVSSISQEF